MARGDALDVANDGPARRLQLALGSVLAALGLAALWGVAVGCQSPALAAGNAVKVPMVLLLSVLSALPAALVAQKLLTLPGSGRSVLESVAGGVFASGLILGVLAPLVAIYYQTSAWAGPLLGIGSVLSALIVGNLVFVRSLFNRRPEGARRRLVVLPALVFIALQGMTLVQFIALASPIFPETTRFDAGIDGLIER
jgi:hypothetical protein